MRNMTTIPMTTTSDCYGRLHGHNKVGSVCTKCGMTAEEIDALLHPKAKEVTMDDQLDLILHSIEKRQASPNYRIHSSEHDCADQISHAFGERARFGQYLSMVRRLGAPTAFQIFSTIKQFRPPAKNPAAVFFFKAKKTLAARKQKA